MNLRNALFAQRKLKELTQAQLAEKIGIKRASYVHIERGTRNPSLEVAMKLAEILECKMDDIFLDTDVSGGRMELTGTTG
jgi:putative transcriptional regulator